MESLLAEAAGPVPDRVPHVTGPAPGDSQRRDSTVLAVVLVGAFMAVLDAFVVNVAIPSIRVGLDASQSEIELVVAGYFLTYACLMITGGRLGDIYDRKRVFLAGMAVFTVSSAACGFAPSAPILIASRAVQGIGAALMYPQILSIIQLRFKGVRRASALGAYAGVIGIASVAGQLIGGTLIQADLLSLGWRAVFLVNVPVGIAGVAVGYLALEGSRAEPRPTLDAGGLALVTVALAAVILPLTEGPTVGWTVWTVGPLVAAPLLLAAFVLVERGVVKRGRSPIVNPGLFRQRGFSLGIPIGVLYFAGLGGLFFTLAVFLQSGLGLTPLVAGLTYVPLGLGFTLTSLLSPRLSARLGKLVLVLGYGIACLGALSGLVVLEGLRGSVTVYALLPSLFVIGCGNGLGMSPLVGTILARVRESDVGPASGVLATVMQVGQGVGVAAVGLLFFVVLGAAPSLASAPVAEYAHAFAAAIAVIATLTGACLVLALALPAPTAAVSDQLLGGQPHRLSRLAYSFYFLTGGRIGRPLVDQVIAETGARRNASIEEAPREFGEFLVHHYRRSESDREFFRFLTREALDDVEGAAPLDAVRAEVIRRSIQEIRDRQADGSVRADLDPECLRLMAFALVTYPRVYGKIAHHVLGLSPHDPAFDRRWTEFLRKLGATLSPVEDEKDPRPT